MRQATDWRLRGAGPQVAPCVDMHALNWRSP